MKFYLVCGSTKLEDSDGQWATRDDAEQAAKDAVEMAKQVQDLVVTRTRIWRKAEKIIERYEGGKG